MNYRKLITKNLFLPAGGLLIGQPIRKNLDFLEKSQFWSRDQITDFQNKQLQELIKHVFKNVPFYRDYYGSLGLIPDDIKTRDDLHKLPIITKTELKKNKQKHLAENLSIKNLIRESSSGSTGEPLQFYKTRNSESFLKATALRGWSWMGYKLGEPYVKVSMNPRKSIFKRLQDAFNNSLYLSSNQLTKEEFTKIITAIESFDPLFIRCYPGPLFFMADLIERNRHVYKGKSLSAINTTGSTLHNHMRSKIEKVFGVKIFDAYSCEGGAVFFECPSHEYYHPSEEYAIQEYIQDQFTFSDPQTPLRHITTDLCNWATPFIRYDTEDYVVLGDRNKCPCGRYLTNIKKILGRDSDTLLTPSGKYLIVENFVAYFEWINEVDQIQVVQERIDLITIRLTPNTGFNNTVYKKIHNYWQNYIGTDVTVRIEVIDRIPLTASGKRRTVIRNPQIKLDERY